MSQLALASRADVSTRHLSYLETGRARPSREMVLMLAQALDMRLRERNAFLQAAGFAAMYTETSLGAPPMRPMIDALHTLLRATEPNPTFVMNRRADVIDRNESGQWLLETFNSDHTAFAPAYNIGRILCSPLGNRAHIENWVEVAHSALMRLTRDLGGAHVRDAADDEVFTMCAATLAELGAAPPLSTGEPLLVPVRFRRDGLALNLFSTVTTFGRARDVTLEELRIEMFFPADEASRLALESRSRGVGTRRPPSAAAARRQ